MGTTPVDMLTALLLILGLVGFIDCATKKGGSVPVASSSGFPKCGFGRYDPQHEFCCGSTPVSKARRDLICCNDCLVSNPTGNLLCCNKRGYDPRRQMCLRNGHLVEYVNTGRTVREHPAHRLIEVGNDGGIMASIVGIAFFISLKSNSQYLYKARRS